MWEIKRGVVRSDGKTAARDQIICRGNHRNQGSADTPIIEILPPLTLCSIPFLDLRYLSMFTQVNLSRRLISNMYPSINDPLPTLGGYHQHTTTRLLSGNHTWKCLKGQSSPQHDLMLGSHTKRTAPPPTVSINTSHDRS